MINSVSRLPLYALLFVYLGLASSVSHAMSFQVSELCDASGCKKVVVGSGPIARNSNEVFKSVSAGVEPGTQIILSGNGGDLLGALRLGELIRQSGLHTHVGPAKAECYSACVFAFMGGAFRSMHPQASLGFHSLRDSGAGPTEEEAQRNSRRLLGVYLDQMRIDRRVLDYALTTRPGQLQTIDMNLANRIGLISNPRESVRNKTNSVWQLRASRSGRLLGFAVEQQANGSGSLTLGLTFLNGEYRLLTHFEPSPTLTKEAAERLEQLLVSSKGVALEINGRELAVKNRYPWQRVANGLQAWGVLTPIQVQQMQETPSFLLKLGTPQSSILEPTIQFSTLGLANIVAALGRQQGSQP